MMRLSTGSAALPVQPRSTTLEPLPLDAVTLVGGYWGTWQQTNAQSIIGHCMDWMERVGWIGNLEAAAEGRLPIDRRGREFTDSDVYKLLEAMCWENGRAPDPALDAQIRRLTSIIGAAQEPDGYINTKFGRPGQAPRYSDMEWGHELYCYGHLLQAAVARARTSGADELLEIATRVADHVCDTFGPDGLDAVCGHAEIEVALAEFSRLTGERRYLDQARLFVDRRGHGLLGEIEFGAAYFQDDVPVRDAGVLRGHAVRALYLAAAAVDVAVDTGDTALLAAIERQWERTVERRTYLTGGMGSHHQDEAFGEDFELPTDRAYCETCAGVGSIMLSWRLLLATGRARYADLVERTLHNVVATSPSRDGRSFFYSNTLHQRVAGVAPDPDEQSPRASASQRSAWFEVSCCPTNVARTLASLSTLVATATPEGVQLHLYAGSTVRADLRAGRVELEVETQYPRSGEISVVVRRSPAKPWDLTLRIPPWAAGAVLERDGRTEAIPGPGSHVVTGPFTAGERLVLRLPLEPRFTWPSPRIDAVRGAVAVERGPQVFCLESIELVDDPRVDAFVVDASRAPWTDGDSVLVAGRLERSGDQEWPYANGRPDVAEGRCREVALTPYSEWGERAPGTMRVFLRTQ